MNTILLEVEPYLAAWLQNHFGNPIELMKNSPESILVKRLLDKPPLSRVNDSRGNIAVKIPYSKEKDIRIYNYLSPSGRQALIESFESLFILNMWSEIGDLGNLNCPLTSVIRAWCEKHGIIQQTDHIIDIDQLREIESRNTKNLETVRQKYYRLRKKYFLEKNIKVS